MTPSSKALVGLVAGLLLAGCASKPSVRPDRPVSDAGKPAATAVGKDSKPAAATPPVATKSPEEQFEDALAALKARKLPEARAGFEQLAKAHPEFSGPLTNLAILDARADADAAAISNFNRAVNANPRNAIAQNWLGILYREGKNYGKAEQSYLKSLEINPESAPVVLNLAILYDVYLKRPDQALERYREYQRMTNNRELKVSAWIKALEASQPAAPVTPPAPAKPTAAPKS